MLNHAPGLSEDPLAFGMITAATAASNTAVSRIGFDNDAVMTDRVDCGTYTGGAGAFPVSTDTPGQPDTCAFNDCDTRTARTFGPQGEAWSRTNLHGPPIPHSLGTPIYDSLHGPMLDPGYAYIRSESPYVPMDAEMDWNSGAPTHAKTGCNGDPNWPVKVDAETFAWRMRDLHYSSLSIVHGYSAFDSTGKGSNPAWRNNETIDSWMRTPLNLTRIYFDKLPISPEYAKGAPTGYEYVRDHLGYRLELQHATWPDTLRIVQDEAGGGGAAALNFTAGVVNWGFAAPINPRPVQLVILNEAKSAILWRSESMADPRSWQPYIPGSPFYTPIHHTIGGKQPLKVSVSCGGAAVECDLPIGLLLPDPRDDLFNAQGLAKDYCIRFANDDVPWLAVGPEAAGVNLLGTVHVVHALLAS